MADINVDALEFGVHTFGDVTFDQDGKLEKDSTVLQHVVAEGVLADQVGLSFFGIGEHHRDDFSVSAPEVVLGALAAVTKNIKLGTAVTVLSSDDPVRVYEKFATIDALSGGRAAPIMGRGSFTESFPLFGFELSQYEALFEERLHLLAELLKNQPVTWSGSTRAGLTEQEVWPKTDAAPGDPAFETWVGVGGSPDSVIRAARYGFPLMLAIIGGEYPQFAPYVDLYHRAVAQFQAGGGKVGQHSPGFVAADDATAKDVLYPHYKEATAKIGRERGWAPGGRGQFEAQTGLNGAIFVGGPETIARKVANAVQTLGLTRFDLKYSFGTLPHDDIMESIRLFGEKVVPLAKDMLASGKPVSVTAARQG